MSVKVVYPHYYGVTNGKVDLEGSVNLEKLFKNVDLFKSNCLAVLLGLV